MRVWLALAFIALGTQVAFAHPAQTSEPYTTFDALDASLAPTALSTRALLAMELPRLVVTASPRAGQSILENPLVHALFKGVRMPTLNTNRDPEERFVMLAVRPYSAGGVLRFRVRFDSGLFDGSGPLRRFLSIRRPDV